MGVVLNKDFAKEEISFAVILFTVCA